MEEEKKTEKISGSLEVETESSEVDEGSLPGKGDSAGPSISHEEEAYLPSASTEEEPDEVHKNACEEKLSDGEDCSESSQEEKSEELSDSEKGVLFVHENGEGFKEEESEEDESNSQKDSASSEHSSIAEEGDSIPVPKEMHIYYDKDESETSEEEDIIEGREETTLSIPEESGKRKKKSSDGLKKIMKECANELEKQRKLPECMVMEDTIIKMRERGWKPNCKPLIWKYKVAKFADEPDELSEDSVLEKFRCLIEAPESKLSKSIGVDSRYSKKAQKKKKSMALEMLGEAKSQISSSRLLDMQKMMRQRAKEEKEMQNTARNLHVKLKEIGYQTEASEILALLTQEYICQKADIVKKIEASINTVSAINSKKAESMQYLLKCIAFVEEKFDVDQKNRNICIENEKK
ncbi:uncharacterized protein NEMAJ01_1304 [Nematocida major]|uniref:uncharacterized protein n=1 Tax=Nematocida major TaxID=1912982 RepID=UPI002008605B|nr:uncharacterized protein NEMAJ01_1304 [Nematocida major]KAH9386408.1 hypothetical protein NEMAJ01_1304 [Nematocida major]